MEIKSFLKVTVHVGTDQNSKLEIFVHVQYKYTLNELTVKKIWVFNTSNSLPDTVWRTRVFTGSKS